MHTSDVQCGLPPMHICLISTYQTILHHMLENEVHLHPFATYSRDFQTGPPGSTDSDSRFEHSSGFSGQHTKSHGRHGRRSTSWCHGSGGASTLLGKEVTSWAHGSGSSWWRRRDNHPQSAGTRLDRSTTKEIKHTKTCKKEQWILT